MHRSGPASLVPCCARACSDPPAVMLRDSLTSRTGFLKAHAQRWMCRSGRRYIDKETERCAWVVSVLKFLMFLSG